MNPDFISTTELNAEGFTLKILPPTFKLAVEVFNIFDSDREKMTFFLPDGVFESIEETYMHYKKRTITPNRKMFQIFQDDELLGEIGFSMINPRIGKVEIAFWIKKSARGNGIINKLLPHIEKMAFDCDWCHKIQIHCDTENTASRKIAEKNGYKLEGIIRKDSKWPNGSLRDKCYFGKLKSDI